MDATRRWLRFLVCLCDLSFVLLDGLVHQPTDVRAYCLRALDTCKPANRQKAIPTVNQEVLNQQIFVFKSRKSL
jgi:hypothetical protein